MDRQYGIKESQKQNANDLLPTTPIETNFKRFFELGINR